MIVVDGVAYDELSSDPTSPQDGQAWYNTTEKKLKFRRSGVTVSAVEENQGVDFLNQLTGSVSVISGTTSITISSGSGQIVVSGASSGEDNTASNLGSGVGVFKTKSGVDFQFKSLLAGPGVTVTSAANEVVVSGTVSDPTIWEVSGTTTLTTTSGSYIQLGNMTITPGAGTYSVLFNSSADVGSQDETADFAIFQNGSIIPNSPRHFRRGGGQGDINASVHITTIAKNVGAGQAIAVRYKTSSGALVSVYERSFRLFKIDNFYG